MSNTYLYQNKPFIQHGTSGLTSLSSYSTIFFPQTFPSIPTVTCTPSGIGVGSDHDMISLKIGSITTTSFQVLGWLKDGRAGQTGGSQFFGNIHWIAVI